MGLACCYTPYFAGLSERSKNLVVKWLAVGVFVTHCQEFSKFNMFTTIAGYG